MLFEQSQRMVVWAFGPVFLKTASAVKRHLTVVIFFCP